MPSAVIRERCAKPGCEESMVLRFGCAMPKGWGETVGDFTAGGEWIPSVFWCPAHAEGTRT